MKTIIYYLLGILLLLHFHANAQSVQVDNIEDKYGSGVEPILQNGVIDGYSLFLRSKKKVEGSYVYLLKVYDKNLNTLFTQEYSRPKKFQFLQCNYNGVILACTFYDVKEKNIEYVYYSTDGKEISHMVYDQIGSMESSYIESAIATNSIKEIIYTRVVPKIGFVNYIINYSMGRNFDLFFVDNNGKEIWKTKINNSKEKDYIDIVPILATDQRVITAGTLMKSNWSNDYAELFLHFQDVKTGKMIKKIANKRKDFQLFPSGGQYAPKTNEYYIFGEYYKLSERNWISKGQGMFIQKYSSEGELIAEQFYSWGNELKLALNLNDKGKTDKNMSIMFLELIIPAEGNFYMVAEEFKKDKGFSGFFARRGELHLIEFSKDLSILKAKTFEKSKYGNEVPGDNSYMSNTTVGQAMRIRNLFDYKGYVSSEDFSEQYLIYTTRNFEDKKNYYVGTGIIKIKNNQISNNAIQAKLPSDTYLTYPAIPGYYLQYVYFAKENKAILSLEKSNLK